MRVQRLSVALVAAMTFVAGAAFAGTGQIYTMWLKRLIGLPSHALFR
jgi:hypothetical protein